MTLLTLLCLLTACGQVAAELPATPTSVKSIEWSAAAIGYDPGSQVETASAPAGGLLEVSGSGTDIWGESDEFFYLYTPIKDNASLSVRLHDFSAAHEWSKAGIMIRTSVEPGASNAFIHISAQNGSVFQARLSDDAATTNSAGNDPTMPVGGWLRLTRFGDSIIGYLSSDGTKWDELGRYTLPMGEEVLIGLAVTAHSAGNVAVAYFSDLNLVAAAPPPADAPQKPTPPTDPTTDPTEPATDPTEPTTDPTEPATDPTDPTPEPTDPTPEPTDPTPEPTDPTPEPTKPAPEPTKPAPEPAKPAPEPTPPDSRSAYNGAWVCGTEPLRPAYTPTYYVATNGNDNNDGRTTDRPFRTLQRAANVVSAGDVVWVRGGTYSSNVSFQRSGTADRPIVFESYPRECAILDGSGQADYQNVRFEGANYNHFRNFIVRNNPAQGIQLVKASDNVIEHVRTHNNGLSGIQNLSGDRNRFSYFITHDNSDGSRGDADGIGLSSGRDHRIDHCVAYRNSDDGVDAWLSVNTVIERCVSFENGFQGGDGNGFKLGGRGQTVNTIIRYSVSFGNKSQGYTYNSGRNVTLDQNTSYNNGGYGFIVASGRLRNNLAYGDGKRPWEDDGGNNQDANSWNAGIGNPAFLSTDPYSPNFLALAGASPAKDKGSSIGLPFTGRAPDLGAIPVGETMGSFLGIPLAQILNY